MKSNLINKPTSKCLLMALTPSIKPVTTMVVSTRAFHNTSLLTAKKEEHPIIGFENPKTWYEKLVVKLNLHKIPQVVLTRQVQGIYTSCEEMLDDNKEFFVEVCGLPDNFQTWFSITQLHLWMVMVRIRAEPNGRATNQMLVNRFFNGVEHKIRDYGIKSERIVVKTVKEMIQSFRGSNLAYDEGMCKSDLVLAAALWRNFFTTCEGSIKEKQIAYMVRYVRSQLLHLENIESKYIYNGIVEFQRPTAEL
ncbi:hypothetical protein K502DRAFT_324168 [Neoconidiobolus thromboides FSU 785]|nr:hypothetical protein K502DRAFT_324168 [Neoconidiobolus thromboides FSU 785]